MQQVFKKRRYNGKGEQLTDCDWTVGIMNKGEGAEFTIGVSPPGVGYTRYRVIEVNREGFVAEVLEDTSRILEPWEVM